MTNVSSVDRRDTGHVTAQPSYVEQREGVGGGKGGAPVNIHCARRGRSHTHTDTHTHAHCNEEMLLPKFTSELKRF